MEVLYGMKRPIVMVDGAGDDFEAVLHLLDLVGHDLIGEPGQGIRLFLGQELFVRTSVVVDAGRHQHERLVRLGFVVLLDVGMPEDPGCVTERGDHVHWVRTQLQDLVGHGPIGIAA